MAVRGSWPSAFVDLPQRVGDVADDLDRVLAGLLPSVAGLRDAAGRVYPLVPARRHVIGSGPACIR